MKHRYFLSTFMLLLLLFCLGSLAVYANGITLEMIQGDRNKLPKGPSPANLATYDPTEAETFTLTLTGFEDNEYYDLTVVLSPSHFKGYAANFPTDGDGVYNDLEFLKSDYVQKTTEDGKEKTTYPLGWKWGSVTELSFSIDTTNNAKPGKIVVRCHDWGAKGSVAVTIEKRGEAAYTLTMTVPYDEENKNGIADAWEDMSQSYTVLDEEGREQTKRGYDPTADKEVAPIKDNQHPGDGWTNADEYRGLFTEQTDARVTRLDPKQKDVIYTMHTNLQGFDLDQMPDLEDKKHEFRGIDSFFVKNPWTEIYEYDDNGTVSHKTDIDAMTGRVNYNSNPGGSYTRVSQAKNVWAMRIMAASKDDKANKKPTRLGHTTPGSPSQFSLLKILPTNIAKNVNARWGDVKWHKDPNAESVLKNKDTHQKVAQDKLTALVIAHEIVHSLNIHSHCNHLNCLMRDSTPMKFYQGGNFYIAKQKKNPKPEPNMHKEPEEFKKYKEFVDVYEDGAPVVIGKPAFNTTHLLHLAVTGAPGTLNSIADCSCVVISSGLLSFPDAPVIKGAFLGKDWLHPLWGAPVDDGGSPITDYEYQYRASGAVAWSAWTSTNKRKSVRLSNLAPGTSYEIAVRAKNSVGYSVAATRSFRTTGEPQTVPGPPVSLSAVGGDGSVALSWEPPASDGHSAILRYEYRYGVGATVEESDYTSWTSMGSAMSTYPVSPLVNGSYHLFQVRAVNAIGPGGPSVAVGATPTAPPPTPPPPTHAPGVPTGLTQAVSNGTVKLSWTAPEDDGGGIDNYQYRIDENNDGSWGKWIDVPVGSTSVTLMAKNGRHYSFQVRAKNSIGPSTSSVKVTALPVDPSVSVPSAPSNLRATAENGQVRLSWGTPSTGTPVIAYEYKYDTNDDGSWRSWKLTGNTSTSHTVTGLTNETVYAFLVRARNTGGIGTSSSKVTATPTAITVPGKTRNLTAALTLDNTVRLDWDAPLDDGGSLVTGYKYCRDTHNDGSWGSWVTTGSPSTSKLLSNVTAGVTYAYRVRAVNKRGDGTASDKAVITIPAITPPSVPRNFSATAGIASVALRWEAPAEDGGAGATYQYRYRGSGSYTAWSAAQSGTTANIGTLTPGTSYQFEVRARNSAGISPTATDTATPNPFTIPGSPTGVTTTASNGTVTLSWTAPTDDGGGIDNYQYRIDENNDGSWGKWIDVPAGSTSVPVSVSNGLNYGFQVRAKNSAGNSTQSVKSTALPVDPSVSPPSAPRTLKATAENGQVRLSWNTPSTGTPVIAYEYRLDTNDDGTWRSWKLTGSTSTSFTVTGLTNDTVYAFLVRARNTGGIGTSSSKVTATPFSHTAPGKTRNLMAAYQANGSIYLEWDAPTDDGGSPITDYEYVIDTHDDGTWEESGPLNSTDTDAYLWRWDAGITYAFKIRAVNAIGTGPASEKAVVTVPPPTTPSAPQYLTASEGNASVYLTWSYPADDGYGVFGGTVDYQYRYRQSGGSWSAWSAEQWESDATISDLTNGTSYEFEVCAVNDIGTGPAATVTATPTGNVLPGVPTYFDTHSEPSAVDLWWDPPEYDGGSPITDYEYRYKASSSSTWNAWTSAGNANVEYPEYTVTGLTNGTAYDFQVRARNAVGPGPSTATQSETPSAKKPDTPTGLSASAGSTEGTVDLSWSAPADNGSPITDYSVTYGRYQNNRWIWIKTPLSIGSTNTAYTVTGLVSGVSYRFRVIATNSIGSSRQSKYAAATAP